MPAYTTAVTSAAVNVATHFTPNGIPGLGDQVTIANGHTLMVPPGVTWDIGDAAAPTTPAIRTAGTAGTGRLIVNGAVRTHADLLQGNAQWEVVGAGAFVESANTTTALTWTLSDGNFQGNCLLVVTGTGSGANRAQIRNGAGAAGFRFIAGASTRRLQTQWARFFDLGTASLAALPTLSTGLPITVRDTVFDSCGSVSVRTTSAAADLTVQRVEVRNSKNPNDTSVGSFQIDTSVDNPTGARVFEDIMVRSGRFLFLTPYSGGTPPVFTRCAGRFAPAGGGARIAATFVDCVFLRDEATSGNLGNVSNISSNVTRGIFAARCPNGNNLHGLGVSNTLSATTVDGLLFDAVVGGGTGDALIVSRPAGGGPAATTVRNVTQTVGNLTNGQFAKLMHVVSSSADGVAALPLIEHCTWITNDGEEGFVNYGETLPSYTGIIGAMRHNLIWGRSAGNGVALLREPNAAANNVRDGIAPANVTDNAIVNPRADATNGAGNKTLAGGDGLMWSASAPTYTTATDPLMVDSTRNLATWYRSLVGGAPGTRTEDMGLALDALCGQWGDAPVAGATITAAYTWIREGLRPQNTALRTNVSTNNGGWQGAMEGVGVATLTPDATISNTNWSAVGAATLHAALASGDADYIESSTNGAVATVSLTDPVPNLTALTSVVVAIRHRVT